MSELLRLFCNFVIGLRKLFPRHKKTKKKRYAHQVFGNVGNFQIAYSDGIVVLTLSVGCYYYICMQGFPTTSKLRRGLQFTLFIKFISKEVDLKAANNGILKFKSSNIISIKFKYFCIL